MIGQTFRAKRNKKRFAGERALLFHGIRKAVGKLEPGSRAVWEIPNDNLLYNGALVTAGLACDPTLAVKAFSVESRTAECHRLICMLMGTIAFREMIRFCGYQEEHNFTSGLHATFLDNLFPELRQNGPRASQLGQSITTLVTFYNKTLGHRDQEFGSDLISFLLKQDQERFDAFESVKTELLALYDPV